VKIFSRGEGAELFMPEKYYSTRKKLLGYPDQTACYKRAETVYIEDDRV